MSDRVLILGGVSVPLHACLDLQQTYETLGGTAQRRMMGGRLVKQSHWQKLRTVVRAGGWIPPGLVGLDYSTTLVLSCVEPRAIVSASNVFTVPAARRSDSGYAPAGWALVGSDWQETDVALVVNTATLDAVPGATQYRVMYFPELTVFADPPQEQGDINQAAYSWTLTAEEV